MIRVTSLVPRAVNRFLNWSAWEQGYSMRSATRWEYNDSLHESYELHTMHCGVYEKYRFSSTLFHTGQKPGKNLGKKFW